MHVDRSRLDRPIVAPHAFEQAISRQHAIPVLNEVPQELELPSRESHGLVFNTHRHRIEISHQMLAPIHECLGGRMAVAGADAAAPQHRTYACGELAKAEWLGDVVVGPDVEAGHAIALAGARRQHDDRHARRACACAQDAADLESAQHREIEIEDDQIRRAIVDRLQCFVAGPDDIDVDVAAFFEAVFDEPRDVLLVIDDEDLCARGGVDAAHARVVSTRGIDRWHPHSVFMDVDPFTVGNTGFCLVTRELNLGYGRLALAETQARPGFGSIHG